ncbi:hypothetical protein LZ32DRAFT_380138 [Colletotrichum eremochloae]|nr:hypothetical protein LZ32DRAFT_380138 [Colletotrichum eremochloae]
MMTAEEGPRSTRRTSTMASGVSPDGQFGKRIGGDRKRAILPGLRAAAHLSPTRDAQTAAECRPTAPEPAKKTPTTTTTKHPPPGGLSPTASQASTRDIFFRLSDSLLIIPSSRYDPRAWPGLLGRSGLIGNHPQLFRIFDPDCHILGLFPMRVCLSLSPIHRVSAPFSLSGL